MQSLVAFSEAQQKWSPAERHTSFASSHLPITKEEQGPKASDPQTPQSSVKRPESHQARSPLNLSRTQLKAERKENTGEPNKMLMEK